METRTLQYLAEACGGELTQGSPTATASNVCTDSRLAQPGDLFLALRGERFDAHDFLADVTAKNVSALLVEKARLEKVPASFKGGVIAVANVRKALGQLAARYRADFDLPIIAVGGSNGKTTTKEILAAVLSQKFEALWSEASFNNDIGVPLTLLKLKSSHRAAVLEVGTNHPGELAPLLQIIRPRFSIITSIGREHLEFFGDMTGVVREESALAEFLPMNGKLFVNAESEWVKPIVRKARVPVVKVGQADGLAKIWGKGWAKAVAFCARNVRLDDRGVTFAVMEPGGKHGGDYRVNLLGRHQVLNSLLAVAVAVELGLTKAEIQAGLIACQPAKMRMETWSAHGVRVLDDAYNANADSMLAALQTLHDLPCAGRRVAVIGDMAELGTFTAEAHAEIGRSAAQLGVQQLFAIGKMAAQTAGAARLAGLKNVVEFAETELAAQALKDFVRSGDLVLLKASRSARLERISEVLKCAAA